MPEYQEKLSKGKESKIHIKTNWGSWDNTWLTNWLYRHVKKGDIEFELKAKEGSLLVEYFVSVAGSASVVIAVELGKYIWLKIKRKRDGGKILEPVYYKINDEEHLITGSEKDKFPPHKPYYESVTKSDKYKFLPKT